MEASFAVAEFLHFPMLMAGNEKIRFRFALPAEDPEWLLARTGGLFELPQGIGVLEIALGIVESIMDRYHELHRHHNGSGNGLLGSHSTLDVTEGLPAFELGPVDGK